MLLGNKRSSNVAPELPAPQSENDEGSESVRVVVSPIAAEDGICNWIWPNRIDEPTAPEILGPPVLP